MTQKKQKDETLSRKEPVHFYRQKREKVEDRLLEKIRTLQPDKFAEMIEKYELDDQEQAKAVYLMESEYDIPPELTINYFRLELDRLLENNQNLPDIYTYKLAFVSEESAWLKLLSQDFPRYVYHKLDKLRALEQAIFGEKGGTRDDAALYILERKYLVEEIIIPLIKEWKEEHFPGKNLNGLRAITIAMSQKQLTQVPFMIEQLLERVNNNLEIVSIIIEKMEIEGWVEKAANWIKEIKKDLEDYKAIEKEKKAITLKLVAELIIEMQILIGTHEDDIFEEIPREEPEETETKHEIIPKRRPIKNSMGEYLVQNQLSLILQQRQQYSMGRLVTKLEEAISDYYSETVRKYQKKPMAVAQKIIQEILEELAFKESISQQKIKKFKLQLLDCTTSIQRKLKRVEKETTRVDEGAGEIRTNKEQEKEKSAVIDIFENILETTITFAKQLLNEERTLLEKKNNQVINETKGLRKTKTMEVREQITQKHKETITERKETTIIPKEQREEIPKKKLTKEELWDKIKDEYLQALFTYEDEINAGTTVLYRLLLEQGLLLPKKQAEVILQQEIKKKKIDLKEGNQEEIDKEICKIIFEQITAQKSLL
jgi:hypothetical protein